MRSHDVIIFGLNDYSLQIAKQIRKAYRSLRVYVQDEVLLEECRKLQFKAELFDLSDSWDEIAELYDTKELLAFCTLEDEAENIFLTISLRAAFDSLTIIALSDDQESANKIMMAGANKVIHKVQTAANIITEILEKPIVNDVLHSILYDDSDLKIAQLTVAKGSVFVGKHLYDIPWHTEFGIIVLAIVDLKMSTSFIFTGKGYNHRLDVDDALVVIGYDKDIQAFERSIGGECETDWCHWSR